MLLLKWTGIGLMIAATSMTGIMMSANLSRRVSELEACLLLLEKMQTCLRYEQTPTGELIEKLSSLELFSPLPFLRRCLELLRGGEPFPRAWEEGLRRCRGEMHLSDKDAAVLLGISRIIGASDAKGQISALDVTREVLGENLREARQKKETCGRLYRSLGVLSGAGLGIFLL